LAGRIKSITGEDVDIEEVSEAVKELLDKSIESIAKYEISNPEELKDLSKIDFKKIKATLDKNKKHIVVAKLKQKIKSKLFLLLKMNSSRETFAQKFQKLIDEYNEGIKSIDEIFDELSSFAKELSEEEKRGLGERLTEEELAIYDLLFKPNLKKKELEKIKHIARELLKKLKSEKLVLDWRKKQQTRADVVVTIKNILYEQLPESYDTQLYIQKSDLIYRHIYDKYYGEGRSIYSILEVIQ